MKIPRFIDRLRQSTDLGPQITYHHYLAPQVPQYHSTEILSQTISDALKRLNINKLFTHQTEAIRKISEGKDILVATPTASGKSMIYNLPVIECILTRAGARARVSIHSITGRL